MASPTASRPESLRVNTKDAVAKPSHRHRPSLSPSASMVTIPLVSPEPAYIAPAAAANIVTSEICTQFGIPLEDEDAATVAPSALNLINSFLDRLLFNFLSASHSTALVALRPAVIEVLKPRLAKEAIQSADDELQEYIGEDEDELDLDDEEDHFDLDLIWKRTRLRCMVYTRLGDMEEDDEDLYVEQENLDDESLSQRLSVDYGVVSPAVAIFLTSILEFVGEHALMIAAHAAWRRYESKARLEGKSRDSIQSLSIEDSDMEKVAFNPIMGRLWRSWRRFVRSPRESRTIRAFSPIERERSRRGSQASNDLVEETVPTVEAVLEEPDPTRVPLPLADYDVEEIEVPGFSALLAAAWASRQRPSSLFVPEDWTEKLEEDLSLDEVKKTRRLSHSMPLEVVHTVEVAAPEEEADDAFVTPFESADKRLGEGKAKDEQEKELDKEIKEKEETDKEGAAQARSGQVVQELAKPKEAAKSGSKVEPVEGDIEEPATPLASQNVPNTEVEPIAPIPAEAEGEERAASTETSPASKRHSTRLSRTFKPKNRPQSEITIIDDGSSIYDQDPEEDPLQFESSDYVVNENEHDLTPTMAKSLEPIMEVQEKSVRHPSHETSFLRDANDRDSMILEDQSGPQQDRSAAAQIPEISPVEERHPPRRSHASIVTQDHSSVYSEDVSPIEPSDDEHEEDDGKSKVKPLALGNQEVITPPMVSPLDQPPLKREAPPIQQSTATRQPIQQVRAMKIQEIPPFRRPAPPQKQATPPVEQTPPPPPAKQPTPPVTKPFVPVPPPKSATRSPPVQTPVLPPKASSPMQETSQPSPRSLQARQRRSDGPTDEDFAKQKNREVVVVDRNEAEANERPVSDSSSLSASDLQVDGTIKKNNNVRPEPPGTAPNLEPLREMMENAQDTSDEASTASHQEPHYAPRDQSLTPASVPKQQQQQQQQLQQQKPVERRTMTPTQGLERAAVQRISPAAAREVQMQPPSQQRTADNSPRESKSYTSRSRRGGSTDIHDSNASQHSNEKPQHDRQRSFENLIESGETVKYTLTPQNMRDIESRNSAQLISPPITPKTPNFRVEQQTRSAETRPPPPRVLPTATQAPSQRQQPTSNGTAFEIHGSPVTQRVPQVPQVPQVQQARDARVERKPSTRSLADYIRSSGPSQGSGGVIPRVSTYQTRSSQIAREKGRIRTTKGVRLVARDPKVRGGETAELIDFIRRGPTGEGPLPRRNPDANAMLPRKQDSNSFTSTVDSFTGHSVQSSTNSRTALVGASRASATPKGNGSMIGIDRPGSSSGANRRVQSRPGPDPEGPVRNQRRFKDQYAMYDVDDEDEDENDGEDFGRQGQVGRRPPPGRAAAGGRDESLLEFLNSAPPPSSTSSQPMALQLSEETIRQAQLRYSQSVATGSGSHVPPGSGMRSRMSSAFQTNRSSSAMGAYDSGPPSVPPKSPMGTVDENGRRQQQGSVPGPAARRAMPRPMARDPRPQDGALKELAAFLNSTPPGGNNEGRGGFGGGAGAGYGNGGAVSAGNGNGNGNGVPGAGRGGLADSMRSSSSGAAIGRVFSRKGKT